MQPKIQEVYSNPMKIRPGRTITAEHLCPPCLVALARAATNLVTFLASYLRYLRSTDLTTLSTTDCVSVSLASRWQSYSLQEHNFLQAATVNSNYQQYTRLETHFRKPKGMHTNCRLHKLRDLLWSSSMSMITTRTAQAFEKSSSIDKYGLVLRQRDWCTVTTATYPKHFLLSFWIKAHTGPIQDIGKVTC